MSIYIDLLKLEGHEEGGYFAIFYKSSDKVVPLNDRYSQIESGQNIEKHQYVERNASSSIYFLLEKQGFSAWHRLKSDEIWHYYDGGSPIDIHVIDHDGQLKLYTLGNPSLIEDAAFQIVIKAGVWFAAEVRDKSSFGLMGCTVSPAFEYHDFELAKLYRDQLIKLYPELINIIDRLIKPQVMSSSYQTNDHVIALSKSKFSADDYIKKLKLEKHQEGGFFSLNYKSTDVVVPLDSRYRNSGRERDEPHRFAGSSIYYLLDKDDFSAWHRLKSDEIWHYYDGGSPIDIHVIDHDGQLKTYGLGNPLLNKNASFQVIIKAGVWFAAEVHDKESFGLIGCTVSPAFEYGDFVLVNRKNLVLQYPEHEIIINKFTRIELSSDDSWAHKLLIRRV